MEPNQENAGATGPFCTGCGARSGPGHAFCAGCGRPLQASVSAPVPPSAGPPAPPPAPPPAEPDPAADTPTRPARGRGMLNEVWALLGAGGFLLLLLGGLHAYSNLAPTPTATPASSDLAVEIINPEMTASSDATLHNVGLELFGTTHRAKISYAIKGTWSKHEDVAVWWLGVVRLHPGDPIQFSAKSDGDGTLTAAIMDNTDADHPTILAHGKAPAALNAVCCSVK